MLLACVEVVGCFFERVVLFRFVCCGTDVQLVCPECPYPGAVPAGIFAVPMGVLVWLTPCPSPPLCSTTTCSPSLC